MKVTSFDRKDYVSRGRVLTFGCFIQWPPLTYDQLKSVSRDVPSPTLVCPILGLTPSVLCVSDVLLLAVARGLRRRTSANLALLSYRKVQGARHIVKAVECKETIGTSTGSSPEKVGHYCRIAHVLC